MKTIINYLKKEHRHKIIERDMYVIALVIGMLIGVMLNIDVIYWVGFLIIFLPMSLNGIYKKIIELENKNMVKEQ